MPGREAGDIADIAYADGNSIPACRQAAMTHLDQVIAFVSDADAAVRHAAAYLVPTLASEANRILPALRTAVADDSDPAVRASMSIAIAELSAAADRDFDATSTWPRHLMTDVNTPSIVRVAAVIGHRWHNGCTLTDEAVAALSIAAPAINPDDLRACPWLDDID